MIAALIAVGAIAIAVAWRAVATGRASVWTSVAPVVGVAGLVSLLTGRVHASSDVAPAVATVAGIGAGLALYAATFAFVVVAERLPLFAKHVSRIYDQRGGLALVPALILAALVVAPGEELFWRGLFQGRLAETMAAWAAAALVWLAYVAANAMSGSLAIVAAAVVSGAVWGALALWTGGVLAGILCHSIWTGLMVAFPPGRSPAGDVAA